jgi:fumarylacetoacetate (FAA) hydrolase
MKLCMFSPKGMDLERGWPGRVDGDRVVQLAAQTLQAFFTGGGSAREHAEYPLAEVDLRPPVLQPPSMRVFSPFERRAEPFFFFANTASIYGPDDEIPSPPGTSELDYGLALAAVIGAEGAIGGFTIANDWTARDFERAEAGFGHSKSRDFATSIGPVVVTPDELAGQHGTMVARVNGEERSRADLAEIVHPWQELAAYAARDTVLRPGDLLVGLAPPGDGTPLAPGDVVELAVDGIGVLRNRVRAF